MANLYKSKFTGVEIDNSVKTIVSNTATEGQVLTANGTGDAVWQDAKGTEVVANPSLAGTESDLTGLEVAGTKYKVPTGGGTEVVANPSLAGTESDLTGLEVAGIKYKVPSGGSGGGTQLYKHTIEVPNTGNLIIISTQSTAIDTTTTLYNVVLDSLSMSLYYSEMAKIYDVFFVAASSPDLPSFYGIEEGGIMEFPISTIGNDTVTPL